MTPTERAIERLEKRLEMLKWYQRNEDGKIFRAWRQYQIDRVESALARLRRDTNREVTTA
jgi:hypothetical protein